MKTISYHVKAKSSLKSRRWFYHSKSAKTLKEAKTYLSHVNRLIFPFASIIKRETVVTEKEIKS